MIKPLTFLFLLTLSFGCDKPSQSALLSQPPERIISMAPSVTETLYALDLQDRLMAVSTYCTYPEAAQHLPKIGDYGNYNFEAIVSLNPDLVILLEEFDAEKIRLTGLGIPYLETGTYFIADILESIKAIGETCDVEDRSQKLIQQLESRMDTLTKNEINPPRTLLVFNRQPESGEVKQIHAFGTACLHNELLEMAGGKNVVEGKLPFAILSREAIMRLNPDVIIELSALEAPPHNPTAPWASLSSVNAIRDNRIKVISGTQSFIPGPRFIETLEDIEIALQEEE
jgi:iron complex transport system substrate-binding protein